MYLNKKLLFIKFITVFLVGVAIFFIWQTREIERNGFVPTPSSSSLSDLIRLYDPTENQIIESPIVLTGEARGYWFFEASFPIRIYDENDNELGVAIAQANPPAGGDWMTEEFVPFRATLTFKKPVTATGYLVLEKDNPSGLPEHYNELRIPVKFNLESNITKSCKPTGCSGQICSDEELITTCEFIPEYACYRDVICERQSDGECGWTQTSELLSCLEATQ